MEYSYIIRRIKRAYRKVRQMIQWIPVIWNDQDWSDYHIYNILEYKLKRTKECLAYYDRFESTPFKCRDIQWTADLIAKVKDYEYYYEYLEYDKSSFTYIPIKNTDMYEIDLTEDGNFMPYILKYPNDIQRMAGIRRVDIMPYINSKQPKELARALAHFRQERAKKLLFTILNNKIEDWWD